MNLNSLIPLLICKTKSSIEEVWKEKIEIWKKGKNHIINAIWYVVNKIESSSILYIGIEQIKTFRTLSLSKSYKIVVLYA